jgi:TRAP-type C4-dicarboxylate transport system permease small subunit
MGFKAIPAAGLGFFFSSFLAMVFWGVLAPRYGLDTIGYPTAMLVTIAIWLVVAPLAAASGKKGKK